MEFPPTVFVTFGDGGLRWRGAAMRLREQALRSGVFVSVHALDAAWLRTWDYAVAGQTLRFCQSGLYRGFGYWAWKSSALLWASMCFPGHQVMYLDAGSVIHNEAEDRNGLAAWLSKAADGPGLCTSLPHHLEAEWTKLETLRAIDPSGIYWQTNQLQSGLIIIPHNLVAAFANEWRDLMLRDSGALISDSLSDEQLTSFRQHRHDQSVFSLLWKQHGFASIPDQTEPNTSTFGRVPRAATGVVTCARYSSKLPYSSAPVVRAARLVEKVAGRVERALLDPARQLRPKWPGK